MRVALFALCALVSACATGSTAPPNYIGSWQLQAIGDRPVNGARTPMLTLDANGHANGHGGCNAFGGKYAAHGDRLTFSRMISTMMACGGADGDQIMTQEHAFLSILKGDVRATAHGDALTLTAIDGRTLYLRRAAAQ